MITNQLMLMAENLSDVVDVESFEEDETSSSEQTTRNSLLEDLQKNPPMWPMIGRSQVSDYVLSDDIDPASKAVIQGMLAEERKYISGAKTKMTVDCGKQSKEVVKIDSTSISKESKPYPKHWTAEENSVFQQGLEAFGHKWSKIADMIGTKSAVQVRNHARSYLKSLPTVKGESENENKTDAVGLPFTNHGDVPSFESLCKLQTESAFKSQFQDQDTVIPEGDLVIDIKDSSLTSKKNNNLKRKLGNNSWFQRSKKKLKSSDHSVTNALSKNILDGSWLGGENVKIVGGEVSDEEVDVDTITEDSEDYQRKEKKLNEITKSSSSLGNQFSSQLFNAVHRTENPPVLTTVNVVEGVIEGKPYDFNRNRESEIKENEKNNEKSASTIDSQGSRNLFQNESSTLLGSRSDVCGDPGHHGENTSTDSSWMFTEDEDNVLEKEMFNSGDKDELHRTKDVIHSKSEDGEKSPGSHMTCHQSQSSVSLFGIKRLNINDIPKASAEVCLDPDVITKEERLLMYDFFEPGKKTRTTKTPEKYLTIRNTMIDRWIKIKPRYLTKKAVRLLSGRMDISSISRIHKYLERIGAINFINQENVITCDDTAVLPDNSLSWRLTITEEEKVEHPDFFDHWSIRRRKPFIKNPERYLKIRNFFIDLWEVSKPKYITKTAIRGSMKNIGDVNSIGRIHDYLMRTGRINVGLENPNKHLEKGKKDASIRRKEQAQRESLRVISKKSKLALDADDSSLQEKREVKRSRSRPVKDVYDPFKLLECHTFSEDDPAPFTVNIEACSLALMDLHAHLSSTEVIGLLGGKYHEDAQQLFVVVAKPCKSLSTGMQCEMDPVSQTIASESIMATGYQVVGWYHSHPAFAPNPSVRDIETQSEFQSWFSQGGAPFVGMIVSPYCGLQSNASVSAINCLMVKQVKEDELRSGEHFGDKPFQFDFSTSCSHTSLEDFLQTSKELMQSLRQYPLRVNMKMQYNAEMSYLQKVVASVSSHFENDEEKSKIQAELPKLLSSPLYTDSTSEDHDDDTDH